METVHRLAAADPGFILATPFLQIDLADEAAPGRVIGGGSASVPALHPELNPLSSKRACALNLTGDSE